MTPVFIKALSPRLDVTVAGFHVRVLAAGSATASLDGVEVVKARIDRIEELCCCELRRHCVNGLTALWQEGIVAVLMFEDQLEICRRMNAVRNIY